MSEEREITMAERNSRQPRILILSFEESILSLLREVLVLEGYSVTAAYTAQKSLNIIDRDSGRFVVLMDNYQVSEQARTFAKTVFARPKLHTRVRVVGLAVQRWEQLIDLDVYIKMPFTVDDLLDPIAQACAEL
jgi:DNA-binding NtrC family response regulator